MHNARLMFSGTGSKAAMTRLTSTLPPLAGGRIGTRHRGARRRAEPDAA